MHAAMFLNNSHEVLLHGCDGEIKSKIPRVESIIYGVFLFLQLFLSAFGNALVCLAIIRFRRLRTLTNSLIFSLAVTDLLTPFVRVLFIAVSTFRQEWIFGCFWCELSSVLGVFLCASSIMHLCAISIERFIVIRWPLRHRNWVNKQRFAFVLVNIWVSSLLLSLFPYFGFVETAFNPELLDCEISWRANPKMALILACFFFLFPFLVLSLTYNSIFKIVRQQTRRVSKLHVPVPSLNDARRRSLGAKMRVSHILRQELRAVKVIVVVIGVFFVLWLPFFVVTSIRAYYPTHVSGLIQRCVFALAYLNSSCNWIIYSVMNRELRNAFKKMLTARASPDLDLPRNRSFSHATRNRISMASTTSTSAKNNRPLGSRSANLNFLNDKSNEVSGIPNNNDKKLVKLQYIHKIDSI